MNYLRFFFKYHPILSEISGVKTAVLKVSLPT